MSSNFRQILHKKYRLIKEASQLIKISGEIGFDKVIHVIKLFEKDFGHQASVILNKPVDGDLNPIPWYTYPAIEYLKQFDFGNKKVFEYGSGNSSLFWASRSKNVTSVEIDLAWFEYMNKLKPSNLDIHFKETKESYINSIKEQNNYYDLIIVDGAYRYDCAELATNYLSNDGILIIDDSERYPELCLSLRNENLIQIDFFGLTPIVYYTKTTSIFLKRSFSPHLLSTKQPQFGVGSLKHEYNREDILTKF